MLIFFVWGSTMPRLLFAALAALLALPAAAATPTAGASTPLDLETIMADADWMGQPVENPYWSVDGRSLYYELKREGSSVRDLYRVDPASGSSVKLDPARSEERRVGKEGRCGWSRDGVKTK